MVRYKVRKLKRSYFTVEVFTGSESTLALDSKFPKSIKNLLHTLKSDLGHAWTSKKVS